MSIRNRRRGLAILATAASLAVVAWVGRDGFLIAAQGEEQSAERAKAEVLSATGVLPEELKVGRTASLPGSGITRYKLVDARGNIYGVDLDAAAGRASPEAVRQALEGQSGRGFAGKLEAELASRVATRSDDEPINVVYWLKGDRIEPVRGVRLTRREYGARLAAITARNRSREKPLVDYLTESGQTVLFQAGYAPVVVAAVTSSMIQDTEARDDVERIYLERVHRPRLGISKFVVQAPTVHASGINGSGVRIGVVEPGRIGAHPNLPPAQRILCGSLGTTFVSGHKTNVAGVIQSNHPVNRGMAPGSTLIDGIGADFSDAEMMAATECVINSGAIAINMSFGSETNGLFDAFARFVDSTAYMTGRTVAVAVSNVCGNRIGSPEIAFNVLAVGAFGDNNTVAPGDDIPPCTGVVGFSAFMDPFSPNADRQEPDVIAPGHLIDTTNTALGFSSVSGTSFAAPYATGGVGLLQDRLPVFNAQVERARAITMAAARQNLEGDSRLSDRDGAGGIQLAAADRVLRFGQSAFFDSPGGLAGFPINYKFFAQAGQRVRVAIAWSHKYPLGALLTGPTTDLDLVVLGPDGDLVDGGFSTSFDNTYEIVEFTAPVSGIYLAQAFNFSPSPDFEFVGVAVSRRSS